MGAKTPGAMDTSITLLSPLPGLPPPAALIWAFPTHPAGLEEAFWEKALGRGQGAMQELPSTPGPRLGHGGAGSPGRNSALQFLSRTSKNTASLEVMTQGLLMRG